MIREYKPAGFDSWHKYYEAKHASVKKIEGWLKRSMLAACSIICTGTFALGMIWLGCFLDSVSQH